MGDNLDQPTNPVPMKVFQGGGGGGGGAPESLLPLPSQPVQMMEFKGGGKNDVKPFRGIKHTEIPKELQDHFLILTVVDKEEDLQATSETNGIFTVPIMKNNNKLSFGFIEQEDRKLNNLFFFQSKRW